MRTARSLDTPDGRLEWVEQTVSDPATNERWTDRHSGRLDGKPIGPLELAALLADHPV